MLCYSLYTHKGACQAKLGFHGNNRIHEMFHILSSKENRVNDDVGNQNNRWDCDAVYGALVTPMSSPHNESVEQLTPAVAQAGLLNLAGDQSKTVSTKLCSGLLNQPKWIPLRYAPVQIELELVNQPTLQRMRFLV